MKNVKKVLIIGGGFVGCTAVHELKKIIESNNFFDYFPVQKWWKI